MASFTFYDFIVHQTPDGPVVNDPPPIGAVSAFSLELLANLAPDSGAVVDGGGRLRMLGLVFEAVQFADLGGVESLFLVCRRVA